MGRRGSLLQSRIGRSKARYGSVTVGTEKAMTAYRQRWLLCPHGKAGAATIYRNYFAPVGGAEGQKKGGSMIR
jgi:hypothetical protein